MESQCFRYDVGTGDVFDDLEVNQRIGDRVTL